MSNICFIVAAVLLIYLANGDDLIKVCSQIVEANLCFCNKTLVFYRFLTNESYTVDSITRLSITRSSPQGGTSLS